MATRYRHLCPDCTRRLTCRLGSGFGVREEEHYVTCPVHGMGVAAYTLNQSPWSYQTARQRERAS